ncbi:MAG: hypothetical protein RL063_1454 [Pseudomonadota bacterium]
MTSYIRILSFILCLFSVNIAVAQPITPKLIQANYEATRNGLPFAKVYEQLIITGNTYKVESITKGIGVYALFGERKLTSVGTVTSLGLKPDHFELQQGDNPKKALLADFDWTKNSLQMMVKGVVKQEALTEGTQDLASYAYQFMYLPAPLKEAITVTLTTGKKLNQYQYKIHAESDVIESKGVSYKALHLQQQLDPDKTESKDLWLASEHYYVPVRILMVEDSGAKIEQTLTELHVE